MGDKVAAVKIGRALGFGSEAKRSFEAPMTINQVATTQNTSLDVGKLAEETKHFEPAMSSLAPVYERHSDGCNKCVAAPRKTPSHQIFARPFSRDPASMVATRTVCMDLDSD